MKIIFRGGHELEHTWKLLAAVSRIFRRTTWAKWCGNECGMQEGFKRLEAILPSLITHSIENCKLNPIRESA